MMHPPQLQAAIHTIKTKHLHHTDLNCFKPTFNKAVKPILAFSGGLHYNFREVLTDIFHVSIPVILCPPLPLWEMDSYGEFNSTEQTVWTVINYTCAAGYMFPDRAAYHMTECNIGGYWDPPFRHCLSRLILFSSQIHLY